MPVRVSGWALASLGLVALFPITNLPLGREPDVQRVFHRSGLPAVGVRAAVSPRPVALVLPAMNEMALRWQAESKFCYAMPTATGMTGTNSGDVGQVPLILSIGQPGLPLPALTPAVRAEVAAEIKALDIREIIVAPEYPYSGLPGVDPNEPGSAHSVVGRAARAGPGQQP